ERLRRQPELSGVRFYHSLFENFVTELEFSDVLMARVLEHLADPVEVLSKVRGWLGRGGRLHIVVPNADSLHRRLGVAMGLLDATTSLSERDHRFGHHRVYTRALLENHVRSAGFEIEQVCGVFLKPLSNAQMEAFSPELLEGLNKVGDQLPDWCAEIYLVARPAES